MKLKIWSLVFIFGILKNSEAYKLLPDELDIVEKICDKECIFNESELSNKTIQLFPRHCKKVCSNLMINQISNYELFDLFENMEELHGGLVVMGIRTKNASFLKNLKRINCVFGRFSWLWNPELEELGLENLTDVTDCSITFNSNSKMKRINAPNVKWESSFNYTEIEIRNGSSEFCLTTSEVNNFVKWNQKSNLNGKYCPIENSDICIFETLSTLPENCSEILGDVRIESGDEDLAGKLRNLKIIYGKLIINGTDFIDFSVLEKLEAVLELETDEPAVQVVNNMNLNDQAILELKKVYTRNVQRFVFENNSVDIMCSDDKEYIRCYERKAFIVDLIQNWFLTILSTIIIVVAFLGICFFCCRNGRNLTSTLMDFFTNSVGIYRNYFQINY